MNAICVGGWVGVWVFYPFRTKANINIATKCVQLKCGKAVRKVKEEKNRNSRKRINSLVFSLFVLLLIATTDITQKRSLVKKKQKQKKNQLPMVSTIISIILSINLSFSRTEAFANCFFCK